LTEISVAKKHFFLILLIWQKTWAAWDFDLLFSQSTQIWPDWLIARCSIRKLSFAYQLSRNG